MQLNDILRSEGIDPKEVLALRHTPEEPKLRKALEGLFRNNHTLFNAYQQTQKPRVEKQMLKAKYVASFFGHEPQKARFLGLYKIQDYRPLTFQEYWNIPELITLKRQYGFKGIEKKMAITKWFDLLLLKLRDPWGHGFIVRWPTPDIARSRWAGKNEFFILDQSSSIDLPDDAGAENEPVESAYTPQDGDWRRVVERQIRERRGQQQFRESLRDRYGDRCLLTGCKVLAVLEAAHIKPYRGELDNHPENGLLLRADIHTLFDLDLLGIVPEGLRVELHPSLERNADYSPLCGTVLHCENGKMPSKKSLQIRYDQFRESLRRLS
jgi:hypothetical protein